MSAIDLEARYLNYLAALNERRLEELPEFRGATRPVQLGARVRIDETQRVAGGRGAVRRGGWVGGGAHRHAPQAGQWPARG